MLALNRSRLVRLDESNSVSSEVTTSHFGGVAGGGTQAALPWDPGAGSCASWFSTPLSGEQTEVDTRQEERPLGSKNTPNKKLQKHVNRRKCRLLTDSSTQQGFSRARHLQ